MTNEPKTTPDPLTLRLDTLESELRKVVRKFDKLWTETLDLDLRLKRCEDPTRPTTSPNCPNCGTLYRGVLKPGRRPCPAGCGFRGTY